LLGEIVVDDDGMHAVVAEELAHGAAGIGREELQRGGLRRGGGDDDGIVHRAVILQRLDDLRHGRALLADRDIDAVELSLLVARGVHRLLIEEGVDGNGGLAGLAVADDELALAAADRHQRIDRLEPGLHRLMHGFARNDTRRLDLDAGARDVLERPLAVDGVAERIDHPAEQPAAHRHVDDGAGALHRVALADAAVIAEDDDADVVALEVERHALDAAWELDHLAGLDLVEPIDAGDAVADRQDLTDLGDIGLGAEIGDLVLQDRGDFRRADFHYWAPFMASCSRCSLLLSDASTMREPTLTTRPPKRLGSTSISTATLRPTALRNCSFTASRCCGERSCALTTCAVTSPRRSARRCRKLSIMSGSAKRRRFCARRPRKLRVSGEICALSASAAMPLPCSSRDSTGLLITRRRSALSRSMARRPCRSPATASSALRSSARSKRAAA